MTPEGTAPRPPQSRPPLPRRQDVGLVDGVRRPVARTPMPPRPHNSGRTIPVSFGESNVPETPEFQQVQDVPAFTPPAQPDPDVPSRPPLSFEPPKPEAAKVKKQRSNPLKPLLDLNKYLRVPGKPVLIGLAVVALLVVLGGGAYAYADWQARQRDPAKLLSDALLNSLSLKQVAISSSTPDGTLKTSLDFSDIKNPLVSSKGQISNNGTNFGIATYGSRDNTYFSYTDLPSAVSPALTGSTKNAWVQLRSKGALPKAISQRLNNLSDPRFMDFGPVITGNFDEHNRQQISQFLIDRQAYKVQALKATTDTLNGKTVYVLPVKINAGFLKTATQSAALAENFSPNDIAAAIGSLDSYNNASGSLYISADGHQLVRLVIASKGGNYTFDYGSFNNVTVGSEPQTKLAWPQFAPVEWQIESQAAGRQPAPALDASRQADVKALHDALAEYFNQNNDYPTFSALNDGSWFANMDTVDPALQRDPLAPNLNVANVPKAGTYAYLPAPASGNGGCDDISIQCAHYKLVAVLSNGQQFIVQDP